MEIIQLAGYTEEEKLEIAKRYLVPRQIERNGLKKSWISISDAGAAGGHPRLHARGRRAQLEREIGTICRKIARQVAERRNGKPGAQAHDLRAAGRASCSAGRASSPRRRRRTRQPGVATGLAWTPVGGDVLFIEATAYAGQGQAHDHRPARRRHARVRAGGAVLRARPPRASSRPASSTTGSPTHDLHIHVPAGAIAEGRAERGHHDGHRARLAHQRARACATTSR